MEVGCWEIEELSRGKCSYYNFHELQAINLRRLDE